MTRENLSDPDLTNIARSILQSKKYRDLNIPLDTITDLIRQESIVNNEKAAIKSARKKLHQIIASYLGDPPYEKSINELTAAFQSLDEPTIRAACLGILSQHASTRERMMILDTFYSEIFKVSGVPKSILDLACGINPLTFPWMDLPLTVEYHAYDINTPRINFINQFLILSGLQPLGEVRDVLIHPPEIHADVAFFFKEAHRLEQRCKGANRKLWQTINADWLIISLPPSSLDGKHTMTTRMRRLVSDVIKGTTWQVKEIEFENELVFCIKK